MSDRRHGQETLLLSLFERCFDAKASGGPESPARVALPAGGRADGDSGRIRAAVSLALAHEQLGNLKHLEAELDEAAAELARQSSDAAADKPPSSG
jgi:hypothetical protein